MEILGIGPMELILILIVALMVFGPDKLPQIGAKLGRAMRDMRKATRAISEEINSTRAAIEEPARELAEPFQEVAGVAKAAGSVAAAARNPGAAIRDSVLKELNPPARSDQPSEAADTEENTIAPPSATAGVVPPPVQALPAADEAPALLAPPEPIAELPAASESLPHIGAAEGEDEEPAEGGTPDHGPSDPGTIALPPSSTPPEQ